MTAAARTIRHARQLHHAGRWEEAEQLYLQALDASPGETDGPHLLALLHADTPFRLASHFTSVNVAPPSR